MQIRPVEAQLSHADGQDEARSRFFFSQICERT